jgi:hypothetical protein
MFGQPEAGQTVWASISAFPDIRAAGSLNECAKRYSYGFESLVLAFQ